VNISALRVKVRCDLAGRVNQWSREHDCNSSHIHEFLNGRRGPPADMLLAMGLEVAYVARRQ
jgi:hypothetical protein